MLPAKQEQLPKEDSSEKNNSLFNFFVQFIFIAIIFFAIGFTLGRKNFEVSKNGIIPKISVTGQYPQKNYNVDFSLFWQVLDSLPGKYIDKSAIDGQKILYGAISGMVRSLGDPYTVFLDPKQNESIRSELSGSFDGIGIQIGFNKDKRLVVVAPIRDTPADKAGLRAKDLILKIDDKVTFDMTLPEAVDLIRGEKGTKVKLVLQHEGEDKTYEREITRDTINIKSVEVSYKGDKGDIAVIRVNRFGDKTDSEWDSAVGEILDKKSRAVLVDLRNNPGGLLESSIHLGSDFVGGTIVKQQFADGSVQDLSSDHSAKLAKIPLVVLVNGGSASASEIFAGAIQDKGRGKIVGEKTFGKGTVQDVVDYAGGSGLHVTVAKWLTPKGKNIHGAGITPDVTIKGEENTDITSEDTKDPQLDGALELLK